MKAIAIALVLAAVGVAAMIYGGNDSAPGLILIGILLILGATAVGVRAVRRGRRPADRP